MYASSFPIYKCVYTTSYLCCDQGLGRQPWRGWVHVVVSPWGEGVTPLVDGRGTAQPGTPHTAPPLGEAGFPENWLGSLLKQTIIGKGE